jgi:hypothetical protein
MGCGISSDSFVWRKILMLDSWTAGHYFYPSEGNIESYTTSESEIKNVLYTSTVEFPPFQEFNKIPRLYRDITVTEKIDGTNASITITEDGQIRAGCRTRYIYPNKPKAEGQKHAEITDNYGFAAWVEEHKTELLKLGKGRHFGEWYGKGINRNYGLQEKRFALFNTSLCTSSDNPDAVPNCVEFVPVLFNGLYSDQAVRESLERLRIGGSVAVNGFMNAEGVVIYHRASGKLFKATVENDAKPKGATE